MALISARYDDITIAEGLVKWAGNDFNDLAGSGQIESVEIRQRADGATEFLVTLRTHPIIRNVTTQIL